MAEEQAQTAPPGAGVNIVSQLPEPAAAPELTCGRPAGYIAAPAGLSDRPERSPESTVRRRSAGRGAALMARASRFLRHLPNSDALLQAALDQCMEELQVCRGFICLLDPAKGVLEVRYAAGAGWSNIGLSSLLVKDEPGGGITGHVAATGRAYYAPDVTTDPYYICHWPDVRTELAVPLLDTNQNSVGVMVMESDRIDGFSADDRTFAAAIAEGVAAALSVAEYRAREKALIEVGKELSTIVDIKDLMQKVVDLGASLLQAQDCTLLLLGEDNAHVILAASYGSLREKAGQAVYKVGEGLTGWVAEFGQPVRVKDVREDPRWKGLHLEMPPEGIGAFMAVPILGSKGVLGVLRIVRRKRKYIAVSQEFTESDQDLLQTLASQVGVALENCQLLERVIRSERLASWGEMSARAAHMIGNRVFAIKGSLNELNYFLREPTAEQLPVVELVRSISTGITHLEEILREFRDFVVATQLQTSPQCVNQIIREAVDESMACAASVKMRLDLEPDLPLILADPTRLRRAIAELIENSLDFQPNGGCLTFETRRMRAGEPRDISAHLPGGELVVITMKDCGPGVPGELKERVFSPFFSTRAKGMGLGLSIVSGIIQAHRGVIREVGVPGEGAVFEIFLPAIGRRTSDGEAAPVGETVAPVTAGPDQELGSAQQSDSDDMADGRNK